MPLHFTLTQVLNASCASAVDGEIDLIASGGVPGYTYDWSNDGPETPDNDAQDLIGVAPGTYTVTLTDASGCTATTSGTVGTLPATAYLEQFNIANKGYLANYVDDFSAVNWTMSSWAPQPPAPFGRDVDDFFRTTGGVLVGEDFDQDICWTSPLINLNTATQFSVDLAWVGFDNEDYINVKYSIDGGAYVTIPNVVGGGAGTIQYPFPTIDQSGSITVTKTGLSGSTIQIQVCAQFNANNESMTMDNVSVPGSIGFVCPCPVGNLLYVNDNASGANDGSSWTNAFTSLQSALAVASNCPNITQIWVAAGTYKPTTGSDRTISFVMKNNLAIYGGFAGTETMLSQRNWVTNVTTLSGDIGTMGVNTDNSRHVIYNNFTSGSPLTGSAVLDGFTVTGAYFENAQDGGGMRNYYASPTVTNCIFTQNAMTSAGNGGGGGGGMTNSESSPIVTNCIFSNNSVTGAYGGGMLNVQASPVVRNCIFTGNMVTGGGGGGLYNYVGNTTPQITNCDFIGNTAAFGGGLGNTSASSSITNCRFSGNSATNAIGGGGMFIQSSSPAITNCTFSGNTAPSNGGAVRLWSSSNSPTFKNCILWGDSGPEVFIDAGSTFTINNSIVQGGCPAGATCASVLNQDPVFVSQPPVGLGTTGNLRLTPCSPALDAGSDAANATTTDLDGNPRKFEAIAGGQMIDMGAYEFQSPVFSGNILYVNDDATGSNNGLSWANAFTDLQSALSSHQPRSSVTEIWVAAGTYKPTTSGDPHHFFCVEKQPRHLWWLPEHGQPRL
ncbi:MAG: right-handed parallel beta-helix repeat-containing protein [Saprospiraceae bacterium]|nr:right-handed parallel beta-helix repeat-containing protein [Saprospiraceae bacterium]